MKSLPTAILFLFVACSLPAADFYVATDGNDAWSGKLSSANGARSDGPFATLQRARDAIRQQKKAGGAEAFTVHVRGGVYPLARTLQLSAEDSGTAAAPVVYRAYKNEKPVLLGGRQVAGFVRDKGEILKADLASQGLKGVYFRQLLFDGKRQPLARWPNFDPEHPYDGGWAHADGKPVQMYQEVPGENKHTLVYKAADERHWANPSDGEVFVFARYNWWNNIVPIRSIDRPKREITLAQDASYAIRPGDRYYVQNLREELDSPGEWWLDRKTWTLYFWPPKPMAGRHVYAPTLETILELRPGTEHVALRGFTFECCAGTAVKLAQTKHCLIAGNTIRNVGGLHGCGVAVQGGFHNGVVGNDISWIGSDGVALSGGDHKTLQAAENYADNNYIHHVGVFWKQGVGINLRGVGNRASHNLIHDGPRMGIMFGGNNLVIEYNEIRHMNLETEDTGAVYTGGRDWISSRGSVVRYNYFHDMIGWGANFDRREPPKLIWNVYLDDNTGGVDVIGNILVRAAYGGAHLHNGRDNLIKNNVFVDSSVQQVQYSGWTGDSRMWKEHFKTMVRGYEMVAHEPAWRNMRNINIQPKDAVLPDGKIMSGNVFLHNILYYHAPDAKLFEFHNVPWKNYESDYNLVYHFGLPVMTGQAAVGKTLSGNLLPNPDFERGKPDQLPDGWHWRAQPKGAEAAAVAGDAAERNRSLRITGGIGHWGDGQAFNSTIGSDELPLKPGHFYRLAAKVKAAPPGAKADLFLEAYQAGAYYWASYPRKVKPAAQWTPCEFIFKIPGPGEKGYNKKMNKFRFCVRLAEPKGELFVDDVSLTEVELLDPWASWQAMGFDKHSLVADPQFVDADKDDYRLKAASPAWRLGFQAIPVDKIGPYRDTLRATWPIVEAKGIRENPYRPKAADDSRAAAPATHSSPLTLYVAPDGNDRWSGRLPAANAESDDGPLATPTAARNKLRQLRREAAKPAGPATVYLRGGVYRLTTPLVLEAEDSGTADSPVVYAAYQGEKPLLSGGQVIGGWKAETPGVWVAAVPKIPNQPWEFRQLFVAGQRRCRARTPNNGFFTVAGKAPAGKLSAADKELLSRTAFRFAPGDLKNWPDLADAEVMVFDSWEAGRLRIARVDEAQHLVTFAGPAVWAFERQGPKQRYYVENVREALTAPGQWHLDRRAAVLRYIPLAKEDMATVEAVAPRLTRLVELRGDADHSRLVRNVTLRGLVFSHADWSLEKQGHADPQAAVTVPAALMADGARDCAIEDCEVSHVGGYGIWLRRGCKNCRVQRCRLCDLGAGGIRVGEAAMPPSDETESTGNRIDNNHVFDGGRVFPAGVGVWVAQSSGNTISHNEIHDLFYSGISIGWNWGNEPNRCHHNTIELNHVHHVMNGLMSDGGAIYVLGASRGSVIRQNVFHDVWPYHQPPIGWGIYLDATTSGYTVENNVVYNTLSGGLMYNNGGHENVIRNNVFALSANTMLWPYWAKQPNTFRQNIVYLTQGDVIRPWASSSLRERNAAHESLGDWDCNLYWHTGGAEKLRFFTYTLAEWKAMGLDRHSRAADPLFVDPSSGDFRLLPGSPAAAIGFQPIDASGVGLYGPAAWIDEARRVNRRENYAAAAGGADLTAEFRGIQGPRHGEKRSHAKARRRRGAQNEKNVVLSQRAYLVELAETSPSRSDTSLAFN